MASAAAKKTAAKKTTTKKTTTTKTSTTKKTAAKKTTTKAPKTAGTPDAPEASGGETTASLTLNVHGGGSKATVTLPSDVFDTAVNIPLIHQVVVAQLAAARQGTHSTKSRGEVRGGGRKPYKQKGTGRARQGSTRAPQFVGGGVVHGPSPRDYAQRTPKKMKAAALRGALSDRARGGAVHIVSELVAGDTPSTKLALAAIAAISTRAHVLVVLDRDETVSWLSLRNVPQVHVLAADQLNTYDVLVSDDVVFSQAGLTAFLERGTKRSPESIEESA